MSQFIWKLYQDRIFDRRGIRIIGDLTTRLLGEKPTDVAGWTKFYEENLKLTRALEKRIRNPILRETLGNRNRDTENLLKILRSGKGTLNDVKEYNSRTIKELKQALEKLRRSRNVENGDEED